MIFFRYYRIERMKRRIEILLAEMAEAQRIELFSQTCSHYERMSQARELATLQYDLRKLQEAS